MIEQQQLEIAICKNRRDTTYKNTLISWGDLCKRLSSPIRTHETYKQYKEMKKDVQDEIKDVGGFVGGHLEGGKRRRDTVNCRSFIALDLDFSEYDFFEAFELIYGYRALCYSTHKHSKSTPKYRLIIPLKESITRDKYEPIARYIAGQIGIDMFDDTTFQAERMMYFPSCSSDSEYYFKVSDGDILDANEVLNKYSDWTDFSSYPVSSRVNKRIIREITKQENPLEKDGLVGAFCKTYSISEAIDTFLPHIYKPGEKGRYSYIEGSSSNGLVMYDDIFCYSHHGTDIAGGQLLNAFDIVRVHKFSDLDENVSEKTNTSKLPSFKAMIEFAGKDEKVVGLLNTENVLKAFSDVDLTEYLDGEKPNVDWLGSLKVNSKGKIESTVDNILIILENDNFIKKSIGYNEFSEKIELLKNVPWRKVDTANNKLNSLKDVDTSGFRHHLEKFYSITGVQKIQDAIDLYANKFKFNPIRDYLESLVWDKIERVDTLFIDYLGADDTDLTRAQTRKALTAAVTRVYRKGAKFDYVLTLVGLQGVGKSTILRKLGGSYYNESISLQNIDKDTVDALRGSWIIELPELTGLKKAETEAVKNFISRTTDEYRKAYGRNSEVYARQCVFFGTTNEDEFLKDATGNRRWWVLKTDTEKAKKSVFNDLSSYEVDQIWAECVEFYKKGEKLYLDKDLEEKAKEIQDRFTEISPLQGAIEEFLEVPILENWGKIDIFDRQQYYRNLNDPRYDELEKVKRDKICVQIIWVECFGRKIEDLKRQNSIEINRCLSSIDYLVKMEKPFKIKGYGLCKGFEYVQ